VILIVNLGCIWASGPEVDSSNRLTASKERKVKSGVSSNRMSRCSMGQGIDLCNDFPADCMKCKFNKTCVYGEQVMVECKIIDGVDCEVSYHWIQS